MIKHNGRDDRLDAFLGSVIEPAAAEYAESMIVAAQNPRYSMPSELDKRCLERINGSSASVRSSLRTILIAAVIAALLGTSAFAVYNEVRQGLVMKREDVDEGSRITFVSTTQDAQPASYQTAADLVLGYIPEGFECIAKTADYIRYNDKSGDSVFIKSHRANSQFSALMDTENGEVTSFVLCDNEIYRCIKNSKDGCLRIWYLWFDADIQMVYNLVTVGLSENEAEKVLEGVCYYNEDY